MKRDAAKNPFIENLIYRVTQMLLPVDGVAHLLSQLPAKPAPAVISFISVRVAQRVYACDSRQTFAAHFPGVFAESGERLRTMLQGSDQKQIDLALVLIGHVGGLLDPEVVPPVKKELANTCLSGRAKEAKLAVRALIKLLGANDPTVADITKKAAQSVQKDKEEKAVSSLAVLSVLALSAPKVFGASRKNVTEFLIDNVLPSLRYSVDFKLLALKMLTNSLVGVATSSDEKQTGEPGKKVMTLLFDILAKAGEVTDDTSCVSSLLTVFASKSFPQGR